MIPKDKYDKYLDKLKSLQDGRDREIPHKEADDILCEMLWDAGYYEAAEMFRELDKWYS